MPLPCHFHAPSVPCTQAFTPDALRLLEALPAALDLLQLGPGPAGLIADAVLAGGAACSRAKHTSGLLPLMHSATASGDRELLGLLLASYLGRGLVEQVGWGACSR